MSKILYAFFRDSRTKDFSNESILSLSNRLEPDNISFRPPKIIGDDKEVMVLFNPSDSLEIHEKSLCHGVMMNPSSNWWKPLSQIPDGSYALYRVSESIVEIATDIVASKTVWYYFDENIFLTSSSQRAIVFFLKSFEFNDSLIPWMLSTGGLGPEKSWDKRIKMLQSNSVLTLERKKWELNTSTEACNFPINDESDESYLKILHKTLDNTVGTLDLDYSKWVLPLSGGYDSRGILLLLKDTTGLKSITWGERSSLKNKKNDAYIAKKLAADLKIEHDYLLTDISEEPVADIFNRFLICGEGRVDLIGAYLDGLKIWKDLFEGGIRGVIRGDEAFGHLTFISEFDVWMKVGIPKFSYYGNLSNINELGIEELDIPEWMLKKKDETNGIWFDRLYQIYRLPHVIAALNEIKLTYVEVITPLLSKQTLEIIRQMPDNLRENKVLFKNFVNKIGPKHPYARYDAIKTPEDIYKRKDIVLEIINELKSDEIMDVLPGKFIEFLLKKIQIKETTTSKNKDSLYKIIKSYMPDIIKRILRNTVLKQEIDFNNLAFRAYLISKMNSLFKEDAKALDDILSTK